MIDIREPEREFVSLRDRISSWRETIASNWMAMAGTAEGFASYLEGADHRGESERRRHLARVEREVAEIARENARRLRDSGAGRVVLQHLPRLRADGS